MCIDNARHLSPLSSIITSPLPAGAALSQNASAQANQTTQLLLHTLTSGDTLQSVATASDSEGKVVLEGTIGPFPYRVEIAVRLDGDAVVVTLEVKKPIPLGPYEWRFNLTGVRRVNGEIVAATGLVPATDLLAARLDWWCVLRCGGVSILGVLLKCLPSLAGGPAAYIACVTGSLGASAATIAECIALKCT